MIGGSAVQFAPPSPEGAVIVICRSPVRRALVEPLLPGPETYASAMEALLRVARLRPRAVLLNVEDVEGSEREVLSALRRSRPDVPVYLLVRPEDEPLGRRLVTEGAADYFVLPGDVFRLPKVLEGGRPADR